MSARLHPVPTQARVIELFTYDKVTGIVRWRITSGPRRRAGSIAGTIKRYVYVGFDGATHLLHRIIWLYVTGNWPTEQIDHKNRDGLDNRWKNLRLASPSQNQMNTIRTFKSKTGFSGVTKIGNKYRAAAYINNKYNYLGTFKMANEAHQTYTNFVKLNHGEFYRAPVKSK